MFRKLWSNNKFQIFLKHFLVVISFNRLKGKDIKEISNKYFRDLLYSMNNDISEIISCKKNDLVLIINKRIIIERLSINKQCNEKKRSADTWYPQYVLLHVDAFPSPRELNPKLEGIWTRMLFIRCYSIPISTGCAGHNHWESPSAFPSSFFSIPFLGDRLPP